SSPVSPTPPHPPGPDLPTTRRGNLTRTTTMVRVRTSTTGSAGTTMASPTRANLRASKTTETPRDTPRSPTGSDVSSWSQVAEAGTAAINERLRVPRRPVRRRSAAGEFRHGRHQHLANALVVRPKHLEHPNPMAIIR